MWVTWGHHVTANCRTIVGQRQSRVPRVLSTTQYIVLFNQPRFCSRWARLTLVNTAVWLRSRSSIGNLVAVIIVIVLLISTAACLQFTMSLILFRDQKYPSLKNIYQLATYFMWPFCSFGLFRTVAQSCTTQEPFESGFRSILISVRNAFKNPLSRTPLENQPRSATQTLVERRNFSCPMLF